MFADEFDKYSWEETGERIQSVSLPEVERALFKEEQRDLADFLALISPAAAPYLEEMAQRSSKITRKRFGKTIQMYAPLYLSNECLNICTYCGFSMENKVRRKTLSREELMIEVSTLKEMGYDHVLLVTGEDQVKAGVEYIRRAVEWVRPFFSHISIEVQPLSEAEYTSFLPFGLNSVLVYQETYHEQKYRDYHPRGKKSNFRYRLATPDRVGTAGMHKIGLGVLLGLEDWRIDSFFCALHLSYLEKTYWKTKYSISFPRIRPHRGEDKFRPGLITDRELVQLICAWRIFNEEVELSVSTRESEKFRDHIIHLGATTFSAGSKTNPGGYAVEPESLEQFEICDEREPHEIAAMIRRNGYEPLWKDWDRTLQL
ncbi:MAG: 2-iminoacetate synthase ThiH [Bacteroidia bacterium]|nr:2-iminoacetate synthase ThiH [Bacteroidia bacterium]